jgi:hypothetical protein
MVASLPAGSCVMKTQTATRKTNRLVIVLIVGDVGVFAGSVARNGVIANFGPHIYYLRYRENIYRARFSSFFIRLFFLCWTILSFYHQLVKGNAQ